MSTRIAGCRICGGTDGHLLSGDPRPNPEVVCAACGTPAVATADQLTGEIASFEALVAAVVRLPEERRAGQGREALRKARGALTMWGAAAGVVAVLTVAAVPGAAEAADTWCRWGWLLLPCVGSPTPVVPPSPAPLPPLAGSLAGVGAGVAAAVVARIRRRGRR